MKINYQNAELTLEDCNEVLSKNNEIIFFAGGGVITLISESIDVVMHDLGEPWNDRHTPPNTKFEY